MAGQKPKGMGKEKGAKDSGRSTRGDYDLKKGKTKSMPSYKSQGHAMSSCKKPK
jgi:hypothetical protein